MSLVTKIKETESRVLNHLKERGYILTEIGGKTDIVPLMYLAEARYQDVHNQMPVAVTRQVSRLANYSLAVGCEIMKPVSGPIYLMHQGLGKLLSFYRSRKKDRTDNLQPG
jgi:hypothetical protein